MAATKNNKKNTREELVRIALRMSPELRDQVYAVARDEGMPGAVWIRALLIRELDQRSREGRLSDV